MSVSQVVDTSMDQYYVIEDQYYNATKEHYLDEEHE